MAQSIEENKGVCGETKVFCRGNQIVVFDTQNRKKILQVSFKSENFHFKRGIFVNGKLYTLHYYETELSRFLQRKYEENPIIHRSNTKVNFSDYDKSGYFGAECDDIYETDILVRWENGIPYKVMEYPNLKIFSVDNELHILTVYKNRGTSTCTRYVLKGGEAERICRPIVNKGLLFDLEYTPFVYMNDTIFKFTARSLMPRFVIRGDVPRKYGPIHSFFIRGLYLVCFFDLPCIYKLTDDTFFLQTDSSISENISDIFPDGRFDITDISPCGGFVFYRDWASTYLLDLKNGKKTEVPRNSFFHQKGDYYTSLEDGKDELTATTLSSPIYSILIGIQKETGVDSFTTSCMFERNVLPIIDGYYH